MADCDILGLTIPAVRPGDRGDQLLTFRQQGPIDCVRGYPALFGESIASVPSRGWGLHFTSLRAVADDIAGSVRAVIENLTRDLSASQFRDQIASAGAGSCCVVSEQDGELGIASHGVARVMVFRNGSAQDADAHERSQTILCDEIDAVIALSAGASASIDSRAIGVDRIETALAASKTAGDVAVRLTELFEDVTLEHDLSMLIVKPGRDDQTLSQLAVHRAEPEDADVLDSDDATPATAL